MRKVLALLVCLPLLLTGCAYVASGTEEEDHTGLWFTLPLDGTMEQESVLSLEVYDWETLPSAEELMNLLLVGPEKETLRSPFPAGLSLLSLSVEDGLAVVNLSEAYGGLVGYSLTVADYCITLTLCQREDIDTVQILADGEELPYRDRQYLTAGDVLATLQGTGDSSFIAMLYYPMDTGGFQIRYRLVDPGEESAEQCVLEQLLAGSGRPEPCLAFPENTKLLSVITRDGLCQVNLSREFADGAPEEEAQASAMVYAVVNTLCALEGISQVELQVEGESLDRYGPLELSSPLSATE